MILLPTNPYEIKNMNIMSFHRMGTFALLTGALMLLCNLWLPAADAAVISRTVCVGALTKTMKDGAPVTFWGFTDCGGGMMMSAGKVPGPTVEVGVGDTLNLTLNMMMAPHESANSSYQGHTIHLHGADVPTGMDGVPETGATLTGQTYTWIPTAEMAGSYMYHCHVHTVKHLDMGMYGALIVRPKDAAGNTLYNQLTSNPQTAYDIEQSLVFSTVDPDYHTAEGDSTVFGNYNPRYFLINGNEGAGSGDPAVTVSAAVNNKVALRLIGIHAVGGTFSIRDGAGTAQPFTVYVEDGRQWPVPETKTQLDIGSGQRFDIVFTTPATGGTAWYPQMTYKKLRGGAAYATTYTKVTF